MRPAFSMFTFIAYYGLSLAWKEAQPAMPQTADLLWKRYHRYERKSPDPSDARRARRESAKGRLRSISPLSAKGSDGSTAINFHC